VSEACVLCYSGEVDITLVMSTRRAVEEGGKG